MSALPQQQQIIVTAIPIHNNGSSSATHGESPAATWPLLRQKFELTVSDSRLSCGLCGDPAIPFTVLTPCGHVACQECAEDSSLCPQCDKPILARTMVPQLLPIVLRSTTFRCLGKSCFFSNVGDIDAAMSHECGCDAEGDVMLEQVQQAILANKMTVQNPSVLLRVLCHYRHELVPLAPQVLRQVLDHLVVESATSKATSSKSRQTHRYVGPRCVSTEPENPPLAVDPVGVPRKRSLTHRSADQPLSAAAAPPAVSRRRAHIYWDYATISPRSLGVPPSDFLDGLVHVFQRTFNICCGEVRCVVYLTGSREDENELRELGALLRFVRVVERSDAAVVFETCKALDCDLQQLIEENLEENVTLLDVVLVSNEANFNAAKGILRECGMHVHAVHDSVTVLEEANFSRGCSTTTDVKRLPCVLRAQQRPAESLRSSRSRSNGSLNEERSSYLAANQSFSSKGCESDNDERYL